MILLKILVATAVILQCVKSKRDIKRKDKLWSKDKKISSSPSSEVHLHGNIVAGVGYSSDLQQVVPQICYNAHISSTSEQQGFSRLDTSVSFSELERTLGMSVSISGKFPMFSAEAQASYIRSVQDKEYLLSLNYYEYVHNNVALQLDGYSTGALTDLARSYYQNGKNPYFGLICGDNYVTSYKQGALLTMGLVIKFSSSNSKQEFEEKAGVSFGSIVNAAESIKRIVSQYQINGNVIIQAFQIGGDPGQLAKVLNKDSSGKYYALTCSLTAMDDCVKAAGGLLDYAKDEFSTQFSFTNKTGLTPLGIAFTQYNPIKYIGLIPPVSFVTDEVAKYRNELAGMLRENEYYQQKLYPFFNSGYPVQLDGNFLKKATSVLSKVNRNVDILMQAHDGAADCFNFPDKCELIKSQIASQVQSVVKSDLLFLEDIKYSVGTLGGVFYNTGGGAPSSWIAVAVPTPIYQLYQVRGVSVTDKLYSFNIDVFTPDLFQYEFNGASNDGITYVGTLCDVRDGAENWEHCWPNNVFVRQLSPFYFEAYNFPDEDVTYSVILS